MIVPSLFILLLWIIKLSEILFHFDLYFLGIKPLSAEGLPGIITSPLIHGDMKHLFANSIPLFVLGSVLFYFYRSFSVRIVALVWIMTGLWVWVGGRESWHIGASGLVYGIASFLFLSGILKGDTRLLAITLLVTFLYGSMVWGIFPDFFPERNISWESHLWGLAAGAILAVFYRKQGPQRKKYEWEMEEEEREQESLGMGNRDEEINISYHPPEKEKN